jgi:hypothetical protein
MDTEQEVITLDESMKKSEVKKVNFYEVGPQGKNLNNDMSKGQYSCSIEITDGYSSRQKETVQGILEVAAVKPEILDMAGDIFMNNISAPGMNQVAERYRAMLLQAGQIPFDQMTEEEQQQAMQAAQQPAQPDPMMIAAQAEVDKAQAQMVKAETDMLSAQATAANNQAQTQIKAFDSETKRMETMIKAEVADADIGAKEIETFQKGMEMAVSNQQQVTESGIDGQ